MNLITLKRINVSKFRQNKDFVYSVQLQCSKQEFKIWIIASPQVIPWIGRTMNKWNLSKTTTTQRQNQKWNQTGTPLSSLLISGRREQCDLFFIQTAWFIQWSKTNKFPQSLQHFKNSNVSHSKSLVTRHNTWHVKMDDDTELLHHLIRTSLYCYLNIDNNCVLLY